MKENYTHISICLDRSGSMSSMAEKVVEGFNKFVEDQKKEKGEATISLAQFDDVYEVVHDFINIKDMGGIKLVPRNGTALLDAMGQNLEETRAKVLKMKDEDQPSKVIFVFITDGEENASTKYKRNQIFAMIKDLRGEEKDNNINWEFVFIGANQDAISEGSSYGISARSAITFDASGAGATSAFASLSTGMKCYRSMQSDTAEYAFSAEDREAQDELMDKKGAHSKPLVSKARTFSKGPILSYITDLDEGLDDKSVDTDLTPKA